MSQALMWDGAQGRDLASRVWDRATALAGDPVSVELALGLHSARSDHRCTQCRPRYWPCVTWQAATLARMIRPGGYPWFGTKKTR